MNTHKHIQHGKHRWLVAAPLFVLFLTLSVRDGFMHLPQAALLSAGDVTVGAKEEAKTIMQDHVTYKLEAGAQMDLSSEPALLAGTALVYSSGLSHIKAGAFGIEGWNGGYQITVSGQTVTVATLSTPVLISYGTHQTVIPPLMQWKGSALTSLQDGLSAWYDSRKILPLPEVFSHDRLQTLAALVDSGDSVASMPSSSLLSPDFGQMLRLDAAQERAEGAVRAERIADLQSALLSNPALIDEQLLLPDMQETLSSVEGRAAMPGLLSAALLQGKGDLFLPLFVSTPDRLLLALFHPQTRDHTRVLPQSVTLTEDEHLALLLLTPLSDTAPDMLAPLAMEEWQADWNSFVHTQSGTQIFASALPIVRAQIDRLDTLQYPARADAYTTALIAIAVPIEKTLTANTRHSLEDLRILRAVRRLSAPLQDIASSSSEASSIASASSSSKHATLPDNELVSQTAILLQEAGFMTTSQTTLKPVDGLVEVSNSVFGTQKGDTTVNFSFDPVTSMVTSIEQDGQILPYGIPLSGFTDWLKQ